MYSVITREVSKYAELKFRTPSVLQKSSILGKKFMDGRSVAASAIAQ